MAHPASPLAKTAQRLDCGLPRQQLGICPRPPPHAPGAEPRENGAQEVWNAVLNAALCKYLILRAVCEQPIHGYGIIQRLATLTQNLCVPTQATV
jgi:hypothetical protein